MSTHDVIDSISCDERGIRLLTTSALNKGTTFKDAERAAFGLEGLLPPSVETIYQQQRRILQQLVQNLSLIDRSNTNFIYYVTEP
jgi:hypothetical protein